MNKKIKIIISICCLLKLTMHLFADYNTGFQGDELLHIQTGNHLAFGFMEFPPLISLFAFIQNLFNSQSVFVHHIFSHIASILIMVFIAKITIKLGGKFWAVLFVLLAILIAPGFGRSHQLFQPVVFSQLFWVMGFYYLTSYIKSFKKQYLLYLTITLILGFSVKYDAIFFVIPLSILFFYKSIRNKLIEHKFWYYIIMLASLLLPNFIWQIQNDFPVLKMMNRLYESQLNKVNLSSVITDLFFSLNPINTIIITFVLVFFSSNYHKKYRPLLITIIFSFLFLAINKGKFYYYFPMMLTLFPFGAVALESHVIKKRTWVAYPIIILQLSSGYFLIPFGLPVEGLKTYLNNTYKYENRSAHPDAQYNIPFNERYTENYWKKTMLNLKLVNDSLTQNSNANTVIWGKHYRQAGAINLYRKNYDLPEAFSLHGSFYSWLPENEIPKTIIALSYTKKDFFETYFEDVELAKRIHNNYADEEEMVWQYIYICSKPKLTFKELKYLFKDRVFE